MKKAVWKWLVIVLVSALIWFAPVPWGISDQAWRLFALFFGAILAVLINATSILLSALLALIMAILTAFPKDSCCLYSLHFCCQKA